jgi:hypothetical protein
MLSVLTVWAVSVNYNSMSSNNVLVISVLVAIMCWLIMFIVALSRYLQWDNFSLFVLSMILCNSNTYLHMYSMFVVPNLLTHRLATVCLADSTHVHTSLKHKQLRKFFNICFPSIGPLCVWRSHSLIHFTAQFLMHTLLPH